MPAGRSRQLRRKGRDCSQEKRKSGKQRRQGWLKKLPRELRRPDRRLNMKLNLKLQYSKRWKQQKAKRPSNRENP